MTARITQQQLESLSLGSGRPPPGNLPEDRRLEIPLAVGVGKPEEVEQIWIAENHIRRDMTIFLQCGKFLTGKLFGFSGESGAFEQHPLDF